MKPLATRAQTSLSGVLGRYSQLEIVRGQGCYLYDAEGTAYLDFSSGIGVASTGHCHPKVVQAIQTQAQTLMHACIGVAFYPQPIALAEKLGQLLGHSLNSVFFCQSGTESVEAALKLAKYVTKKSGVLAFTGGFHGRSLGALSITTSKMKYRSGYEPLLPGVSFFPYPYAYHSPEAQKNSNWYKAELVAFLATQNNLAAIIIEPILGEGGYTKAPNGFLQILRDWCTKNETLLIFDEIQSGCGRTGSWFAFQDTGVVPDVITLAKGIGSGFPLAACVSTQAIMSQWTPGAHGGTYGANPMGCAAGLATLEVLEEALPHVKPLGELAKSYLTQHLSSHKYVGDIRQYGLMIGVEFLSSEYIKPIVQGCLDKQLVVISCGVNDNVIRLVPPLIIDEATLLKGLSVFCEVVHELN